jgi:hypothetical protein
VARRAESCSPFSPFMRHRVRRRRREWKRIGASGQFLNWIRHGVRVNFKRGVRPRPFNHGTSMLDATPAQLEFLDSELPLLRGRSSFEYKPFLALHSTRRYGLVPTRRTCGLHRAPSSSSTPGTRHATLFYDYQVPHLLGTDTLGTTAIGLLMSSLAPSAYANYDSSLRHCFAFCAEENLPPYKPRPLLWSATLHGSASKVHWLLAPCNPTIPR